MKGLVILSLVAAAYAQNCGVPVIDPIQDGKGRIVNGIEARPNSWPWQVAMCTKSSSSGLSCGLRCGSTVIATNWILTAAHCVDGLSPSQIHFKYAAHSLTNTDENGQGVAEVAQFVIHSGWNSQRIINDIAVVRISTSLTFGEKIQPICLANTDDHLTSNTPMFDIGWGRIGGNDPPADRLQQTLLTYHDRSTCSRLFLQLLQFLDDSVMCAGGTGDGKSVCFGDSGGPFFKQDASDNRYYQYGVNSFVFSQDCYQQNRPNGFARVPFLCNFVDSSVGQSLCLTPPEARMGLDITKIQAVQPWYF